MKNVFIFNAPKASGKDEAVKALLKIHPQGYHISFKDALFDATAEHFEVDRDEFVRIHSDRSKKEEPILMLPRPNMSTFTLLLCMVLFYLGKLVGSRDLKSYGFLSTREALIHTSEDVYKPLYGNDYFGKLVAEKIGEIDNDDAKIFISDGGFVEELRPILENPDVKVTVIHLHRDGCVYDSTDSRGFVTEDLISHKNLQFLQLHNNGTIEDLHTELCFLFYDVIFNTTGDKVYGVYNNETPKHS